MTPSSAAPPLRHAWSASPGIEHLVLLTIANRAVAETLLRDGAVAALAHPHFPIVLSSNERTVVDGVQRRCKNADISEMLCTLVEYTECATIAQEAV